MRKHKSVQCTLVYAFVHAYLLHNEIYEYPYVWPEADCS